MLADFSGSRLPEESAFLERHKLLEMSPVQRPVERHNAKALFLAPRIIEARFVFVEIARSSYKSQPVAVCTKSKNNIRSIESVLLFRVISMLEDDTGIIMIQQASQNGRRHRVWPVHGVTSVVATSTCMRSFHSRCSEATHHYGSIFAPTSPVQSS